MLFKEKTKNMLIKIFRLRPLSIHVNMNICILMYMYIHQYTYRCILNMMKRSWFSFILFFHFLIYLWIYFFESGVEGYSSFWMGDSPLKKNNFYLNQETSPHCREHVHTGTLYTGIDYSILKISSLFNKRENKNLKLEKKNNTSTK